MTSTMPAMTGHPEDYCHECGRPNLSSWSVDSDRWNLAIERMAPGPYVELFARQPRLGWDSWGWGYEGAAS